MLTQLLLEPGARAFWLLRGPWPAKSEERARFFPLLQPAAIVQKVNTPHSLSGKSSNQEWEEIKSPFQPSRGEPTRAGLCHWAPTGNAETTPNSGPESTALSLGLSDRGFSPMAGPLASICLGLSGALWRSDEAKLAIVRCSDPQLSPQGLESPAEFRSPSWPLLRFRVQCQSQPLK